MEWKTFSGFSGLHLLFVFFFHVLTHINLSLDEA